jgi:hypothetical protein
VVKDAFKTQSVAECDVEKDWATVQSGFGIAVKVLAFGLKQLCSLQAPFGGPAVATVLLQVFDAACQASAPPLEAWAASLSGACVCTVTSDSMLARWECQPTGYEQPAQLQEPDDSGKGLRGSAARRSRVGEPGIKRQAR